MGERVPQVTPERATAQPPPQPAGSGLTRATPLVEAFEYTLLDGLHVHLGWQPQGNQFRRAVVYHNESIKGGGAAARAAREALSREHPEFFTMPDALRGSGGGRKEFNHFAPGFPYVYSKQAGMTVGELKRAAVEVHAEVVRLRKADAVSETRPGGAVHVAP